MRLFTRIAFTSAALLAAATSRAEPLLVYAAQTQPNGPFGLYWTNTGGRTTPLPVQSPLGASMNVAEFDFIRQGSDIIYRANQFPSGSVELYSGGTYFASPGAKINPIMAAGRNVTHYALSKNSASAAFIADAASAGVFEVHATKLDGTLAPQKVNSTPVAGGNVLDAAVSPDGKWMAFRGDILEDGKFEAFASAIPSTTTWKINMDLAADEDVINFAISPDSSRIAFLATQSTAGGLRHRLFARSIKGTGSATPIASGGAAFGDIVDYKYSTFGGKIAFIEDRDTSGQFELYLAPPDGSSGLIKVNSPMAADKDVQRFLFSPNGQWLAFETNIPGPAAAEGELFIYSVPGGGAPLKVNQDASGNAGEFAFSPDSSLLVYQQSPQASSDFDLYVRQTNLSDIERKINGIATAGESIESFAIGSQSRYVAYIGDQPGVSNLYLSLLDGSGAEQRVNPAGQLAAAILAAPIELKAAAQGAWELYR